MRKSSPFIAFMVLGFAGCGETGPAAVVPPDLNSGKVDCLQHPELPECGGCQEEADCAGKSETPRCDVATHLCVACLPQPMDNCPAGSICHQMNGIWSCGTTCVANADCNKLGGGSLCCKQGSNGFCLNPATDVKNCGSCGHECEQVNNGSAACAVGNCVVGTCNPGYDDCDKSPINGCETVISNDSSNCGACGVACKPFANGAPTCTNGKCASVCQPGFADCNNDVANGCEIDTTFDIVNCGGCGKACAAPANAVPYCDLGKCSYRCKLGFADCDGNPGNGCESNANNDPSNCGHCGNICPLRPNANGASCANGQCVNSCNMGFGDCDNLANNGCEADLNTSLAACGGCGKPCLNKNAIATCAKGMCTLQCNAGYSDCNMDGKDGCEAKLLEDAMNCGGCGNACPQQNPFCSKGVCGQTPPYPAACTGDSDPITKAYYVICAMDASGGWIASDYNNPKSQAPGNCQYNAELICKKYGFTKVPRWGGTCGTVCGYCSAGSCWAAGNSCNADKQACGYAQGAAYTTYGLSGGNPANGGILSCTVHWECAP